MAKCPSCYLRQGRDVIVRVFVCTSVCCFVHSRCACVSFHQRVEVHSRSTFLVKYFDTGCTKLLLKHFIFSKPCSITRLHCFQRSSLLCSHPPAPHPCCPALFSSVLTSSPLLSFLLLCPPLHSALQEARNESGQTQETGYTCTRSWLPSAPPSLKHGPRL